MIVQPKQRERTIPEYILLFAPALFLSGGHTKGGRNKVKGQTIVSDAFLQSRIFSILLLS